MVLPYVWILDASDAPWTLQTLQNLALARLWALGSVRDCGRSCADCGLGALWPETALRTPQTLRHLPMVLRYFWILDASDAPWTLQTVQNLALARLWALGSVRDCGRSCAACGLRALARQILFSSGPKLPFKPLKPLKRFDACQWFCHTSGFWTLQTLHGRFRRSKTSHLLDCGLWALCETVGGVADCGLALAARNCPSNPSNPSNASTLANGSAILLDLDASDAPWTLQTLQNLALARLWALGSVRDCGRSCADCGLRALARQILFF